MRLGGLSRFFRADRRSDLEGLCETLDTYGLSAIPAPKGLESMSNEDCAAFGEEARRLGLVVGETSMWANLLTDDANVRAQRIELVRTLLRNADIMGCHCVVTLVGTKDPSDLALAPHPYMHTEACRAELREIVLRILDGLELQTTKYAIEPWHNTFFYQPEDIRAFIDRVDHPSFGLHLDLMNMVSQATYYRTTDLINQTFDLLADTVASVHLKDIRCDPKHMFLKWDEVPIGEGVMDYQAYLTRLAMLPPDTPCFCEHMTDESAYALNFARLHRQAEVQGLRFRRRVDC